MSNEEMRKMKFGSQRNNGERQVTEEELLQINRERDYLDSIYYIDRMMNSFKGLNILLKRRYDFYEKYEQPLQEFVLWGRYLLTYRGTMQEFFECKYIEKPRKITTMKDFMRDVKTFRRREVVAFPPKECICAKCHAPITMDDVVKGNFIFVYDEFRHRHHKK